jgi:F-type H+-transporting ATPase subunit b
MTLAPAVLLAAAEKSAPLIDIDGTVILQFGIFLVMMAVLYAGVFRPYLRVRDDREKGIGGARRDAKQMEERAAAIVIDYEAQILRAKQRGAEERAKLRGEGQAHEREVLGKAREAANKEIAAARARAQTEQERARQALLGEAPTVGKRIAARVLGREP